MYCRLLFDRKIHLQTVFKTHSTMLQQQNLVIQQKNDEESKKMLKTSLQALAFSTKVCYTIIKSSRMMEET